MITDFYLKINSFADKVEKLIAVVFISAIVIIVFSGTIARYLFENPLFGADRLATYLMVWLGFLGFQMAVSKMRHIEIEAVKSKMKPKVKYLMSMFTSLLAAAFLLIFFSLSLDFMNASKELGDKDIVLEIPLWIIILIIPVSFGVSAIRYFFTFFLWLDVYRGKRKEEEFVQKQLL
jgi:C4-dicarboxylate transporter, DctQ subunit